MSSYESLEATIDLIVDAAIESEMYLNGYEGSVSEGFVHQGPYVHVTGPNASGRRGYGGVATDGFGQPVQFTPEWNIGADVYAKWDNAIRAAFRDWDQLPDPAGLESVVEKCQRGTSLLTDGSLFDDETNVTGGNPQLGDIGFMNDRLGQFNGATVLTFHRRYASRLPIVVRGQSALAGMLWLGARGEQEIMTRARNDVAEVADKVFAAMKAARGGGGGGLSGLFTVVGAVASIAGTIAGGPAGAVIGVAVTGATAIGELVPHGGEKQKQVPFGGDTPSAVYDKLVAGLQELNQDIADQESQLADMLYQAHAIAQSEDSSFNLAAPALLSETDRDQITTVDETRVKIDVLRTIGNTVMPNIAHQLDRAKGAIDGGSSSGPWTRPGSIGMGTNGPFGAWTSLEGHLESLLVDTSWEVRSAGHHLVVAADDFQATDAQAHQDLAAHSRHLRRTSPSYDHDPPMRPFPDHMVPH
jgi:hypothetical protein